MKRKDAMALKEGDVVWLKPFEGQPREKCTLSGPMDNGMFIGYVKAHHAGDDGLREFEYRQIEGKV